jgi:SH3-like domain-containing protein
LLSLAPAEAQRTRQPPYMASIASGEAMMRTWRRIQDPDGTTGWMLVALLSDQRTAIVRGSAPRPMHEAPDEASPVRFRAEPGVVGRVSRCAGGWCHFDVRGRSGYIRIGQIWGVQPGETIR